MQPRCPLLSFFFFNDTATTEIYTLSLHDALPISSSCRYRTGARPRSPRDATARRSPPRSRSEEHTSELQSQSNLVCRLLLEKKKNTSSYSYPFGINVPSRCSRRYSVRHATSPCTT